MASKSRHPEPKIVRPDDIDPGHRWDRPLQAPGRTQVDFEERVDFRRLHGYRLARVRRARELRSRRAALVRPAQYPLHHQHGDRRVGARQADALFAAHGKRRAVHLGFRQRSAAPQAVRAVAAHRPLPRRIARPAGRDRSRCDAVSRCGEGDQIDPRCRRRRRHAGRRRRGRAADAVRAAESRHRGARRPAGDARGARGEEYRRVDAAQHGGGHGRRRVPGHCRSAETRRAGIPDRRARDQAFFDVIQSFMGYRTCYYRTFNVGRATSPQRTAYKKAREWMDRAIELLKPGMGSDKIARAFPEAKEIGFASEMDAFGLNFCHGLGLGLHERPLISRLTSLREPIELKAGMVFAVETYCPATDGISAARIEEEVVLTPQGAKIISLYPAEELPIANPY